MRIAVIGLPKSGASALYAALKEGMPAGTHFVFEPEGPAALRAVTTGDVEHSLVRLVFRRLTLCRFDPAAFDHTLVIVRDPRERLINWLTFRFSRIAVSEVERAQIIAAFRHKERFPRDTPMTELFDLLGAGTADEVRRIFLERDLGAFATWAARTPEAVRIRYEDFIAAGGGDLEAKTGIALAPPPPPPDWLASLPTSSPTESWRSWFTAADVTFFAPAMQPFLASFGYDASDWALSPQPRISSASASDYVARLMARRRPAGPPELDPEATIGPAGHHPAAVEATSDGERLYWLERASGLGSGSAAFEVARLCLAQGDLEGGIRWLRRAGDQDHALACYHLARLLLKSGITGEATMWLARGSHLGSERCMILLEKLHLEGSGAASGPMAA